VLAVVALGVVATLSTRIERGMLASAAELIGGDIGIESPQNLADTLPMKPGARIEHHRHRQLSQRRVRQPEDQLLDVQASDAALPAAWHAGSSSTRPAVSAHAQRRAGSGQRLSRPSRAGRAESQGRPATAARRPPADHRRRTDCASPTVASCLRWHRAR
jgi:predicted lysophospholipase L1 biosynthesis ABC-type transport system permease subunit